MTILDAIPDKLARLLLRYMSECQDGNVTIHFAKGRVAKWEYKMVDKP